MRCDINRTSIQYVESGVISKIDKISYCQCCARVYVNSLISECSFSSPYRVCINIHSFKVKLDLY